MPIKEPDAETWFIRAEHFHYTSCFLEQHRPMALIYGLPLIVLRAFSVEAYLKSLLMLEGKQPPQIHNLLRLFDLLELESKKLIKKRWEKQHTVKLNKLQKQKPPGMKPPRTFRGALSQSSDAFMEWRYVGMGSEIAWTLFTFPLDVRNRILELEPSWRPLPPNPLAVFDPEP